MSLQFIFIRYILGGGCRAFPRCIWQITTACLGDAVVCPVHLYIYSYIIYIQICMYMSVIFHVYTVRNQNDITFFFWVGTHGELLGCCARMLCGGWYFFSFNILLDFIFIYKMVRARVCDKKLFFHSACKRCARKRNKSTRRRARRAAAGGERRQSEVDFNIYFYTNPLDLSKYI